MTTRPAPKDEYPTLLKTERRHISTLRSRREFLHMKISRNDCSPAALQYHRAELDALDWALALIARECRSSG